MTRSNIRMLVCAAFVSSCSSGGANETASLDHVQFSIPSDWQSRNLSDLYTRRVVWTPIENDAKESLVVLRSGRRDAQARAGNEYAARLLDAAQVSLLAPSFTKAQASTTKGGLVAVRVEGTFLPARTTDRYTRHHAVVIDERTSSFVHVIYTAKVPDLETFELVLDSLSLEGNL